MIDYGAVLRVTCFLVSGNSYTNMFTNFSIQVSDTFTIIGLIAESTQKFISNTRSKIFGNLIFEMKVVTYSGLTVKHYFQFTTIKDFL